MTAASGHGMAVVVDHEDPAAVTDLVARLASRHDRLDVLVTDIFGGDRYAQGDRPLWEHDLAAGLRMLRMGVDTHLITAHAALPLLLGSEGGLLVEMTDGTAEVNAQYRERVGLFYDLVKANVSRIILGLTHELRDTPVTALGVTPGWLRSEARRARQDARVRDLGVTDLRRPRGRRPYPGLGGGPVRRPGTDRSPAGRPLRRNGYGRLTAGCLGLHRHLRNGGTKRPGRRAVPLTERTGEMACRSSQCAPEAPSIVRWNDPRK